jgi:outer membrane protein OmpA-like peptidoglycan-associated protein
MKNLLKLVALFSLILTIISCSVNKKNKPIYMQKTFESLKKDLPDATVTIFNDTIKVLFAENVMFTVNSADIQPKFLPQVKNFAKVLNKYKYTSVLVNGYTDNTGSKEYNTKLSKNRAENSKNILIENHVKSTRLYSWGHADKDPIASNDTPEGRQKNRRVEFIILYDVK